jgi:hypothetical protein
MYRLLKKGLSKKEYKDFLASQKNKKNSGRKKRALLELYLKKTL